MRIEKYLDLVAHKKNMVGTGRYGSRKLQHLNLKNGLSLFV
jgi:hypothetical protein